jgi:DNA repair photolyase
LLKSIDLLDDYNQFWFVTITSYGKDIERNVPGFKQVIKTFKSLSDYLGVDKVSWRYDPIFITEKYSLEYHIDKFEEMASELSSYTNDCTISFIDLYKKVLRNFPEANEVTTDERLMIGENFSRIAGEYGIKMKTCVEGTLLDRFGFDSSGCMTKQVIENAIGKNLKIPKGKYEIRECNCIFGRDIGAYNTCLHGCRYCYANFSTKLVKMNYRLHNPDSPLLIGNVKEHDDVKEVREPSYIDFQQKLI